MMCNSKATQQLVEISSLINSILAIIQNVSFSFRRISISNHLGLHNLVVHNCVSYADVFVFHLICAQIFTSIRSVSIRYV